MNWSSPLSCYPPSGGPGLLSRPLRGHLSPRKATSSSCQAANIPGQDQPHCNPYPKAESPRHRGGLAGTLTSTAIKIGPAWQGEEGEGQVPTAALTPGTQYRWAKGCLLGPLMPSCSASRWVGTSRAQLLRAIVSTTCSSLLRSRCLRACSSFSRATRICRGGVKSGIGSESGLATHRHGLEALGKVAGPPHMTLVCLGGFWEQSGKT